MGVLYLPTIWNLYKYGFYGVSIILVGTINTKEVPHAVYNNGSYVIASFLVGKCSILLKVILLENIYIYIFKSKWYLVDPNNQQCL